MPAWLAARVWVIEALLEAPLEVLVPVQRPDEVPVEVLVEVPVGVSVEVLAEVPAEVLVEVPVEVSVEVLVEVLAEVLVEALADLGQAVATQWGSTMLRLLWQPWHSVFELGPLWPWSKPWAVRPCPWPVRPWPVRPCPWLMLWPWLWVSCHPQRLVSSVSSTRVAGLAALVGKPCCEVHLTPLRGHSWPEAYVW